MKFSYRYNCPHCGHEHVREEWVKGSLFYEKCELCWLPMRLTCRSVTFQIETGPAPIMDTEVVGLH